MKITNRQIVLHRKTLKIYCKKCRKFF